MDNVIEATSCFQKIALSSGMVMVMSSQAHLSEEYRSWLPVRICQVIIQKAWGLSGDNTAGLGFAR